MPLYRFKVWPHFDGRTSMFHTWRNVCKCCKSKTVFFLNKIYPCKFRNWELENNNGGHPNFSIYVFLPHKRKKKKNTKKTEQSKNSKSLVHILFGVPDKYSTGFAINIKEFIQFTLSSTFLIELCMHLAFSRALDKIQKKCFRLRPKQLLMLVNCALQTPTCNL